MALYLKKSSLVFLWLCILSSMTLFIFSQSPEQGLIKDLKWRNIGPANMIGRISDFEALDSDFTHVLVEKIRNWVFCCC